MFHSLTQIRDQHTDRSNPSFRHIIDACKGFIGCITHNHITICKKIRHFSTPIKGTTRNGRILSRNVFLNEGERERKRERKKATTTIQTSKRPTKTQSGKHSRHEREERQNKTTQDKTTTERQERQGSGPDQFQSMLKGNKNFSCSGKHSNLRIRSSILNTKRLDFGRNKLTFLVTDDTNHK